jgi:hypothetical protein
MTTYIGVISAGQQPADQGPEEIRRMAQGVMDHYVNLQKQIRDLSEDYDKDED